MEPSILGALLVAVGSVLALAATLYLRQDHHHLRLSKFLSKVDCCFPRIPHSQDQEGAFDLSGGSEVPFEDDLGSGSLAGWKIGG